jgi:predicted membrane metal-binding protein
MRYLKAFGAFWYEFVIGDDPKIAVGVVLALLLVLVLLAFTGLSHAVVAVLAALLVGTAFTIAVLVDVRR